MAKALTPDWTKTADQLPCPVGEQADVIFAAPGWGWALVGMFTHFPDPKDGRWSMYDQVNDKFILWTGEEPTHWVPMPAPPEEEPADG